MKMPFEINSIKNEINKFICLLVVLVMIVATITYGVGVTTGIPLADEWRWIKELLIPLKLGELTYFEYLRGEYGLFGHTHFITLLALYFNFEVGNFDLKQLAYVGLIFYAFGFVILLRFADFEKPKHMLATVVITAIYFNPATDFPWLLVVFEYIYYFGLIAVILLANGLVQNKINITSWVVTCFLSAFLLDSFGAVAVIASILGFLVIEKSRFLRFKYVAITLLSYFSGWLILFVFLGRGVSTQAISKIDTVIKLLRLPYDVVSSLAASLSQPIFDQTILSHYFNNSSASVQFYIAVLGGFFVINAVRLVFKSKMQTELFFPVTLIFVAATAFVLILVTRYGDFGVVEINARRFTRFFLFYYIGAILIYVRLQPQSVMLKVLGFLVLIFFVHSHWFLHKYKEHVVNYFNEISRVIIMENVDEGCLSEKLWICKNSYCTQTIYQLREWGVEWVIDSSQK